MSEHSWKFFGVGGFDQVSLTTGEDIAHSDFLMVGRNGVFYHRKGQDWDATITKIVEQPINVRQASWSPYKKVARFVTSQIEKFAGERGGARGAIGHDDAGCGDGPPRGLVPRRAVTSPASRLRRSSCLALRDATRAHSHLTGVPLVRSFR